MAGQSSLYRFGTNTVIGGTMQFAAPFQMLSASILSGTGRDYPRDAYESDINIFLSKFPVFVVGYVQIVSERYADTIRRNTHLPEIRGKTTMALAKQIREESFGDIERALSHYATVATRLGITLANISTAGSVISGALVGGSLEALATDGEDSLIGMLAGAALGGSAAKSAQENVQAAQYSTAFESVSTITKLIASTPPRLLDAYVSYMFGENANFEARDSEIAYASEITSAIVNACLTVFDLVLTVGDRFTASWVTGSKSFKSNANAELVEKLHTWNRYIRDLQESCSSGLAEETPEQA
jgi:hypothetical protein